jgi:hypothetical protein
VSRSNPNDHDGRLWDAHAQLDLAELIRDYVDFADPPASSGLADELSVWARGLAGAGYRRLILAESDSVRLAAEELQAQPLRDVSMPEPAFRALRRAGVETDRQLAAMGDDELLAVRGIGPTNLERVRRGLLYHCLRQLGCEGREVLEPEGYFDGFLSGLLDEGGQA